MSGAVSTVVIGAGWSGLACAVQLARQGHRPTVVEAAPHAGGRARGFEHDLGGTPMRLDNGQHLLLGAYRDTLDMMIEVGMDPRRCLLRMPFTVEYPDGWRLGAGRGPAPLHLLWGLLRAQRVSWKARAALAHWSASQRGAGWSLAGDMPADRLFSSQPEELLQRLWRPLCLAALNVELRAASAAVLLNVLRDSLGAGARAADLLLARAGLSEIFPDAALAWLRARGCRVLTNTPAQAVESAGPAAARLRVRTRDSVLDADAVVLAVPPPRCVDLLRGAPPAARAAAAPLERISTAPICTCYLRYAPGTRLARPIYALLDEPARGRFGQWVIDRGALDARQDGVLAVVVSGAGPHQALERAALGRAVARQLSLAFGLPRPRDHLTLTVKHATIVPGPGLRRPPAVLPAPGLYLASDAADSPYPSTLEGSMRSGIAAARMLGNPAG